MAFLDDIGKKISETSQSAIQKTKDMAEVAKINSMISDEEKNINNNYRQIGELYADLHEKDCEDNFKEMVEEIYNSKKKIAEFREQIKIIKGSIKCEKCGATIPTTSSFCSSCGTPITKKVTVKNNESDLVKCANCGTFVGRGMKFCTSCGNPMKQEEKTDDEKEKVEKISKKCPKCGCEISNSDIKFCTECGAELDETLEDKANENLVKCTKCGTYVGKEMSFCTSCGNPMKQEEKTDDEEKEIEKSVKKCPKCGFETTDIEMRFCTECGTEFESI